MCKTKICTKCDVEKSLNEFVNSTRNKDGKTSHCKVCEKNRKAEQYFTNKEKINKRNKIWRDNNPHKVKEQHINYYKNNKKILIIERKLYREKNKENSKLYHQEYRKNNKEKINNAATNRRNIDSLYKLTCLIRTITRQAIKNSGYKKKSKTTDMLGCSYEELLNHIESQWLLPHNLDENEHVWMNWKNHGKYNGKINFGWDIDHKIPLFPSQRTEDDLLELCNYTNLQPLCSYINRVIKKNN